MKKIIAILLVAMLFTLPVMAGWVGEPNGVLEGGPGVAYTFQKYAEKPVIDGTLDEFGYSKIDVKAGDISLAFNDTTTDGESMAKNLAFDIYASYDADYIYMFISMDTKYYYNDLAGIDDGNMWAQSAIQMNLANIGDELTDRLEFGIGRNSVDGVESFTIWAQHPSAQAELPDLVLGTDYKIVLAGDRLNYELRTPVNAFLSSGNLAEGNQIQWCLVMAQCDKENGEGGTGGYIHTQVASGCTGTPGKSAENFAVVTLGAAMAGRPAEVVEVAPATDAAAPVAVAEVAPAAVATAPATGDAGIITILVVMMIAAAGIVIFRRKSAVK